MSPIDKIGPALPANRPRRIENRKRRDDGKRQAPSPGDREHAAGRTDTPDAREHLINELA